MEYEVILLGFFEKKAQKAEGGGKFRAVSVDIRMILKYNKGEFKFTTQGGIANGYKIRYQ